MKRTLSELYTEIETTHRERCETHDRGKAAEARLNALYTEWIDATRSMLVYRGLPPPKAASPVVVPQAIPALLPQPPVLRIVISPQGQVVPPSLAQAPQPSLVEVPQPSLIEAIPPPLVEATPPPSQAPANAIALPPPAGATCGFKARDGTLCGAPCPPRKRFPFCSAHACRRCKQMRKAKTSHNCTTCIRKARSASDDASTGSFSETDD